MLLTKHLMNQEVLELARALVRKVVAELVEALAKEVRSAFSGARQRRRSRHKSFRNFDPRGTVRANLRHYDQRAKRLVIRDPLFWSRSRRHGEQWQVIVVVDQSGSMVSSVIHAGVTAACLWGLPAIKTHLVAFDTNVVDLTSEVTNPVEMLMKVQLGGGTDIAKAVRYAASLIENPARTVVVLIAGSLRGRRPRRARALREASGRAGRQVRDARGARSRGDTRLRQGARSRARAGGRERRRDDAESARRLPQGCAPVTRADLLALTPESLARLANVGLVKRAQKEIADGKLPALAEEPDGTIVASSQDGATTRLPRGTALSHAPCTCGSAQLCRHRIAAVLAYQARHAAPAAVEAWDPGAIADEALVRACGELGASKADQLLAKGIVVTVRPGAVPTVVLPTATVQFLVPGDVAYAKCDCARGHGCEHVVLAVRAFRAQPAGGVVTLGGAATAGETHTHEAVVAALEHLAQYGLAAPGSDAKLAHARGAAERAGWWWIADGLEAIERLGDAYHRQSARFRLEALAREVGELAARLRASRAVDGPLPATFVLGSDRAGETPMEQTRLLALGARLDADEDRRMARLYFADPGTASVLVLERTWPDEKRCGRELGQLFASSRMSIAELARGELVTRAARRRPNGALDLGAARGMKSSLLPTTGGWASLPAPLLVTDLGAHAERRRSSPPACLCPRGLGASMAVVAIARVIDVDAAADGQSVTGLVEDAAGHRLIRKPSTERSAPARSTRLRSCFARLRRRRTSRASCAARPTASGWIRSRS